jgi:hypothetical protein
MGRHLEGVDFNHFGQVVSRRAGIIRLIDLWAEEGLVGTRSAGKGEKFTEKGFWG